MPNDSKKLRHTLKQFGLSDHAITAAWPEWWDEKAEQSLSAQNELRFSISRKLGLDPRSLLDEESPKFIWKDEAKFKHFTGVKDFEYAALTSFGISIAQALIQATPKTEKNDNSTPASLRDAILKTKPYVGLQELITLCWALGIPIIQLKIFPLASKLMCAMTARIDDRYAIFVGRDSSYPAQIAFYVAHELGHIFLRHLKGNLALVDYGDILESQSDENDKEEAAADTFALELLTGHRKPSIFPNIESFSAKGLAKSALAASKSLHIEPGTLALCLGYSTGEWGRVYASMRHIYDIKESLWEIINNAALTQLDLSMLNEDQLSFIRAVMGKSE